MKFLVLILACTIGEFSLASPPLGRRGGPPAPAPPPSASTPSPQPPPVARSFGGRYPPGPPSGPPSRGDRPHGIPRPPSPVNTPAPPQGGRGVQVYPLGRVVGQRPGGNDNGNRNGQADRRDTRPVDPETNLTCGTDNDRLPYPSDCSMYYVCVRGRLMKMPCAPGTHFNARNKMCDWPSNANCQATTQAPSTTSSTTADPNTCSREGELTANPRDCSTYYQCLNSRLVERQCAAGTDFNRVLKRCDHPSSANCRPVLTSPPDPDEDCKDQDTMRVKWTQGAFLVIQCKPGFGYFLLNTNCTRTDSCTFPVAKVPSGPRLHPSVVERMLAMTP